MRTAKVIVVVAALVSFLMTAVFVIQNPPTYTISGGGRTVSQALLNTRTYVDYDAALKIILMGLVITAAWVGGLLYTLSLPGLAGALATAAVSVLMLVLGGRLTALMLLLASYLAYRDCRRVHVPPTHT